MPIRHNTSQLNETLEEYYTDLSANSTNFNVDVGKEMRRIVQLINALFKETIIVGLISHSRLVLQTEEDWEAPWLVIVSSLGMKEFYFEYLLPASVQPWENAYVRGQANNFEEAKKYLLIAMRACGGWADNQELKQLLASEGIA